MVRTRAAGSAHSHRSRMVGLMAEMSNTAPSRTATTEGPLRSGRQTRPAKRGGRGILGKCGGRSVMGWKPSCQAAWFTRRNFCNDRRLSGRGLSGKTLWPVGPRHLADINIAVAVDGQAVRRHELIRSEAGVQAAQSREALAGVVDDGDARAQGLGMSRLTGCTGPNSPM